MVHRVREHRIVLVDGHALLFLAERGRAVRQRDDVVALLVCRAHRRLHTAVRQEAAECDRRNSAAAQDEVEVRAREGVQPTLALDHDVAAVRCQVLDDLGAPRALAERFAVDDAFEDTVWLGCELVVVVGKGDRRMDDHRPERPRPLDGFLRVLEHLGGVHHRLHGVVEGATRRCEVVLILDEDDRCCRGIHRCRASFRLGKLWPVGNGGRRPQRSAPSKARLSACRRCSNTFGWVR